MNTKELAELWLYIQYRQVRERISAVTREDGSSWLLCDITWEDVSTIPGCLLYLSDELKSKNLGSHRSIWFQDEDPLLGVSKPITVVNIGLTEEKNYLLEVIGQTSDRIKIKWERKYGVHMHGDVTIMWKESHEI